MLWLLLLLLLVFSGIVSGCETALFGLNRHTLHQFNRSRKRWCRRAHRLMQRPRRVLMTVLIANTAANVSIFTVSFFILRNLGGRMEFAAAACGVLVPLCVIIFGEMLPKAVVLSNPQRFAPPAAGLIATLQIGLEPVHRILGKGLIDPLTRLLSPSETGPDPVTTDELKFLVKHSAQEGIITSYENTMLQAVVALEDVSVREVMTPRVDICSIRVDMPRAKILDVFRTSGRRRLPVCGRDLDDIRGVLYARDLYLNPEQPVAALVRRIHFIPEQVSLMQLLRHFRSERIHLAVVVDEYGGTAGLVTSEDVVEWIVGTLPDAETPRPTMPTEQLDANTYRLAGDLSARVWADRFAVGEIGRRFDTVGGLILAKLGRLPRTGDSVRIQNLLLTVEKMRQRRIERVLLRHDASGGKPDEAQEKPVDSPARKGAV